MAKGFFIGVGNFKKRDLPSGYTQLEYIESTGSQYIDTGIHPNQNTSVELDMQLLTESTGTVRFFGSRTDSQIYILNTNGGTWQWFYGSSSADATTTSIEMTDRVLVSIDGNTISWNDVEKTATARTFSIAYPIYLCGVNHSGSLQSSAPMKIWACRLWDSGTLVRDYVPAKNSSGEVGMFDMVTMTFYTDASGTGFIAGSECSGIARKVKQGFIGVGGISSEYTRLEYIESTGSQYITTGLYPTQSTRVVLDVEVTGSESVALFGARTSTDSQTYTAFAINTDQVRFDYGTTKNPLDVEDINARAIVDMNGSTGSFGGVSLTYSAATFTCAYPLSLMAVNTAGTNSLFMVGRIYSCQIYIDGTTLTMNLVPCRRNSDNAIGMLDIVTKTFYTDAAGTGFIAGLETSQDSNVGVARRIKEAFIGIGGVARPCWAGGELVYYGTITELSVGRCGLVGTVINNYAIFGGGDMGITGLTAVDSYDKSLTHSTLTSFGDSKTELAAASTSSHAIFGGGGERGYYGLPSNMTSVYAYDTSLTYSVPTGLSQGRAELSATTVGDNALFGGGYYSTGSTGGYPRNVDAYNTSLTRSSLSELTSDKFLQAATTVGDYAIFCGGIDSDAYSTSLTKTTIEPLSVSRQYLAATTVGNFALFGGGSVLGATYYSTVDAYDKSLTRIAVTDLSEAKSQMAATTINGYALFGGGLSSDKISDSKKTVDVYDEFLTRSTSLELSMKKYSLAAATIENYAIFAGGGGITDDSSWSGYDSPVVDAYTIA